MRSILRIILLFFISISVFSQGVCDLTNGIEKGSFDAPSAVCIGELVKVKDNSGGTDIKYIFGYSGQPVSQLPSIPSKPGPNSDWAFVGKGNYIILQYGKKNNKDMYLCKVVNVREKSEPEFSYNDCNNTLLEIVIPVKPVNNFDYYTVNWGDGSPNEQISASQLPYKKLKTTSLPVTIKVEGGFNTASSCQAGESITIPERDPGLYPDGYDAPTHANIDQIILTKADKAILTIKGSYDDEGYQLFWKEQGGTYEVYDSKVLPGEKEVSLPDSTKSYCFYIVRNVNCTEISAEICTVVLSDVNPVSNTSQEIIWESYPTELSNAQPESVQYGRYMNSTSKLLKEEDGVLLPEISVINSPYTDNINCQKKYCYRIKTEATGQIYYYKFKGVSISKQMCVDREEFHPPAITDALVTVNIANASEINYADNSPWTLRRDKYILYHYNGTDFKEIMSSTTLAPFDDASVDNSQKSNCYKIAFVDECGSTSELSPPFCTTFLSEANKNELIWTASSPFADTGIGKFDVESYDENTGASSIITSLPASQLTYVPDLSRFEEEAKFRIKITALDGSESYSNTYTIPLIVKLLLPDAFSPNNDAINDRLELKGTFRRIADFDFQIYNRWGNPVFSSSDPLRTWDGNFQGGASPVDTYTYKIYAKLIDGTEINKTGKFLLIR